MTRARGAILDRAQLDVVLESGAPRYRIVAEAACVSGFSPRAVSRALDRGELAASVVCSRLPIHPDDPLLAWMAGSRAAATARSHSGDRICVRKAPAPGGLSLLTRRSSAA
jgi:hypothetical protein